MNQQYAELAELAGGFIHDIKNRIGTITLTIGNLAEDFAEPQNQRERRVLDRVQRLQGECERLLDIANDFLRFARVQDLKREPSDLAEVIDAVIDFFDPMARAGAIEIKLYLPGSLPLIPLDRDLFKQALLNLLLNAQQAMPQGGEVTLQAQVDADAVRLDVIDTGKGMSPEILARAFKPFFSAREGGTGLGLPTTRRIIEAHGGSITVESEVGKGTRFTLRLPVPRTTPGSNGQTAPSGPAPLASLDGEVMPLAAVRIPAQDRGFLLGDAVYEVLRIYGGQPWLRAEHFARLKRSLEAIRINGVDLDRLEQRMLQLIGAGPFQEAMVYLQITRGVAPRTHYFPSAVPPLEFLYVQEIGDPYTKMRQEGVRASLQPDLRWGRCDVKSTNLLGNVLAMQAAREAGGAEALLVLPDGTITEGSHSSLFGVVDGVLRTSPNSPEILPGTTRDLVLRLAADLHIPVVERSLQRQERMSELFLTGTNSEVLPVVQVDDQVIGGGQPGPITRALQQAYREAVSRFREGQR